MKLSKLLGNTPYENVAETENDREIRTLTATSGEADGESVFACVAGHHTDGHLYLREAYERGCRFFICDKKTEMPPDAIVLKTDNVKRTSWELLSKLYNYPQNQMIFIGVTGTKGKTTVVSFISSILTKLGIKNAAVGTLGVGVNGKYEKTKNTTPDFFTLFPLFAKWRDEEVKVVTIEMSSQSLSDGRLFALPIRVGIFTCIGMDHIGVFEHADFRAYYSAKRKLFSDFPLSFAVVNDDDIYSDTVTDTGVLRYTVSKTHPADYFATVTRLSPDGMNYRYRGQEYFLPMPGEHQLVNAMLSAAAVSRLFSVPMEKVLPLLSDVSVSGRFERYSHDGKDVIIDYAHNATSLYAVCSLCRKMYPGKLYAVFGSVGERGQKRRYDLAKMGERMCDLCILTSDNPGFENPYRILGDMYEAFSDKTRAKTVKDRREAVKYAVSLAGSGDVVLLLGKGRETSQNEYGKEIPYSETEALFSAFYS